MGKKPIVSVTYENETISIKNSLPYLKCVLRLSCVVHGPIYGRFMGCTKINQKGLQTNYPANRVSFDLPRSSRKDRSDS